MKHLFTKKIHVLVLASLVFSVTLITPSRAYAEFDTAACVAQIITPIAADLAAKGVAQVAEKFATSLKATALATKAAVIMVPVSDPVGSGILGDISGVNQSHTRFQDVIKMIFDNLAYGTAQCALSMLTENTVEWIKGGFNGSPNYAVDTGKLFKDIADNVVGEFALQIRGLETCKFDPTFTNDLANSVQLSPPNKHKFALEVRCNFPSNINVSEFYNGDFANGGWGGLEASLSDRGNPFGVQLAVGRELSARQQTAEEQQQKELDRSNDFLKIVDPANCPSMPDDVKQEIDVAIATRNSDPTATTDARGAILWPDSAIKLYQQQYCKTTTPGKIVSDQLSSSLHTDFDRLGLADNLNKIITALIGQLTKQALDGIFH